jgi:hypothetical protein
LNGKSVEGIWDYKNRVSILEICRVQILEIVLILQRRTAKTFLLKNPLAEYFIWKGEQKFKVLIPNKLSCLKQFSNKLLR